jgi:hypothetical protein
MTGRHSSEGVISSVYITLATARLPFITTYQKKPHYRRTHAVKLGRRLSSWSEVSPAFAVRSVSKDVKRSGRGGMSVAVVNAGHKDYVHRCNSQTIPLTCWIRKGRCKLANDL